MLRNTLGFTLLVAFLAAPSFVACGGQVEVGSAKDEDEVDPVGGSGGTAAVPDAGSVGGSGGTDAGSGGTQSEVDAGSAGGSAGAAPLDCTEADAMARAVHDAWTMIPNEFGALIGKTFGGYVEGGPDLTLAIDDEGNATLTVGEPAPPPEADRSYLCGDVLQTGSECERRVDYPPAEGAVYPIHGASFTAGRLILPIQHLAPYDAWCALQTPVRQDGTCLFSTAVSATTTMYSSTGMCELGDLPVDCGWMELTQFFTVCGCTSEECFAHIGTQTDVQVDARVAEDTGEITGTFINGERARVAIHLAAISE